LFNPFDILEDSQNWVEFEHHNNSGHRGSLWDYVKRRQLYADLVNRQTPQAALNAFKYLLGLEKDDAVD
jgi:hypothetical protein